VTPPISQNCSRSSLTGYAETTAGSNPRCSNFVVIDGYNVHTVQADLARFCFLLGGDDGTRLFGQDQP
jgi:hypothetical protein